MQEREVTKAAFSLSSAVLATVVLIVSVAWHDSAASKTALNVISVWTKSTTTKVPVRVASQLKRQSAKPVIVAQVLTQPSNPTSTLLPIVNQPSIREDHRIMADAVLRRLPSLCRDNLKNFYVLYEGAKQRGLGGKSTIIIDGNTPNSEFIGLIVHECGHVIHGNMLGNITRGASNYKDGNDTFAKDSPAANFFAISWMTPQIANADATKEDFVTGYAQSDSFEDFAETFTAYVLARPSMEARAKTNSGIAAKLAWMNYYLPLNGTLLGISQYTWDKKVPWDATKMAFVWSPAVIAMQ
jgi:hypothetical protein